MAGQHCRRAADGARHPVQVVRAPRTQDFTHMISVRWFRYGTSAQLLSQSGAQQIPPICLLGQVNTQDSNLIPNATTSAHLLAESCA